MKIPNVTNPYQYAVAHTIIAEMRRYNRKQQMRAIMVKRISKLARYCARTVGGY